MSNTDRRIRKTTNALQNALVSLLKNKDLTAIRVTKTAKFANVHRGTFYIHYIDDYDLFNSIEDSVIADLERCFSSYLISERLDFKAFSVKLYKYILTKKDIVQVLLRSDHSKILGKISLFGYPDSFTIWQSRLNIGNRNNYQYYFNSLIASLNALIRKWVNSDYSTGTQEFADIAQVIFNGYNPVLTSKPVFSPR